MLGPFPRSHRKFYQAKLCHVRSWRTNLSRSFSLSLSLSLCLSVSLLSFVCPGFGEKCWNCETAPSTKRCKTVRQTTARWRRGRSNIMSAVKLCIKTFVVNFRVQFDCLSSRCSHFYDEKNSCTKEMCLKNWFCFLPPGLDCNLAHRVYLMLTCTDNRCEKALHYIASRPLLLEHRTCLNTYRSRMWLLTWKTMSGSCGGPHSRAA